MLRENVQSKNIQVDLPKFFSLVDANNTSKFVNDVFADQSLQVVDLISDGSIKAQFKLNMLGLQFSNIVKAKGKRVGNSYQTERKDFEINHEMSTKQLKKEIATSMIDDIVSFIQDDTIEANCIQFPLNIGQYKDEIIQAIIDQLGESKLLNNDDITINEAGVEKDMNLLFDMRIDKTCEKVYEIILDEEQRNFALD